MPRKKDNKESIKKKNGSGQKAVWGKKKRKKQGAGPQPSYLDHLFASYDVRGSYGEAFL